MKHILCALLLTGLAACAAPGSGSVVRNVEHMPLYSPELVRWASGGRDTRLVLLVADDDRERWAQTVSDTMAGLSWLPLDRVTETPDESARDNFHLALVIDAPPGTSARDACTGDIAPEGLGPEGGASHVLFAFCNDGRVLSTARAVVPQIGSPADPSLAVAVTAAVTEALPRRDPNRPANGNEVVLPN